MITPAYDFGPENINFEPAINLQITWDPDSLPQSHDVSHLSIASWNPVSESWIKLDSYVNPDSHTITTTINHFSIYAIIIDIITENPEPEVNLTQPEASSEINFLTIQNHHAEISGASYLIRQVTLSDSRIEGGNPATITALIENMGDEPGGYELILKINDKTKEERQISLAPGARGEVLFSLPDIAPGMYNIDLNGHLSVLTVAESGKSPAEDENIAEKQFSLSLLAKLLCGAFLVALVMVLVILRQKHRIHD